MNLTNEGPVNEGDFERQAENQANGVIGQVRGI